VREDHREQIGEWEMYGGTLVSAPSEGLVALAAGLEAAAEAGEGEDSVEETLDDLASLGVDLVEGAPDGDPSEASGGDMQATGPDLDEIPVDDAVGLYFSQAGDVPLLTHDEEIALAKQMERGRLAERKVALGGQTLEDELTLTEAADRGRDARRHLIEANTRLAVSIATKFRGRGLPFGDLIQAGNLGLIKAIDRYDYRFGTRVCTYATWWIRQSIMRALARQVRLIRIPEGRGAQVSQIYREANRLAQDGGYLPTPEQIAEELDLDAHSVRALLCATRHTVSLHQPIGEGDDGELGDLIEDETAPAPPRTVEHEELRRELEEALSDLPPREAQVLNLRFGLDVGRSHSLTEVGKALGVSRERARQIENRALRRLRHPRRARTLRHHLDRG
jgi:RNA polymerase primary sigma factor